MAEQTKSKPKLSTTQVILIAGIVVIAAAVVFVGVFVLGKEKTAPDPVPAPAAFGSGNVVVDEQNMHDIFAELDRKAAEGMFEVKMNATWNFPDGKSPSTDAYVANSKANSLPIYFEVETAGGEIVYTSPEIPVGSAVKDLVLDRPLAAGDYECVCTYHLLNEDKTVRSSVSVVVRLHVAS